MYPTGTILTRRETKEGAAAAYNRVLVLGESPVIHTTGGQRGEWSGVGGQDGVLIQPAGEDFGATIDRPFGELQELYDVEFIPEEEIRPTFEPPKKVDRNKLKSPEQVIAEEQREAGKPGTPQQRRNRGAEEEAAPEAS